MTKWVDEVVRGFPSDKRPSIRGVADRYYNPTAKRVALDILCQADKSNKLELAMKLLERDWDRYWTYKAPELINPTLSPLNRERWKALYDELEIKGYMH